MASRFKVEAVVGADVTPLERAFAKAKQSGEGMSAGLRRSLAGAFSVAAVTGYARHLGAVTARIKDMAAQAQVTTKEAQRLNFEAQLTGNQFTDMRMNLNRLGQAREKAIQGDEKQLQLFESLGVAMKDLQDRGKSDLDILTQIGAALKNASPGEIFSFKGLFGVEAFKTLEAVKGLAEDKQLDFITDEEIEKLDAVNKQLELMLMQIDQVASKPAAGVGTVATEGLALAGATLNTAWRFFTDGPSGAMEAKAEYRRQRQLRQEARLRAQLGLNGGLIAPGAGVDRGEAAKQAAAEKEMAEYEKQRIITMRLAAKLDFDRLDSLGKEAQLRREIADLTEDAAAFDGTAAGELIKQDLIAKQDALRGLSQTKTEGGLNFSPSVDALGRIGGSAGGATQTTNNQLKEISTGIAALNRQVRDGINLKGEL